MNYKGDYNDGVAYAPGDVVVYTDGVAYWLTKAAAAGTTPHDVRYWEQVNGILQDVITLFKGTFDGLAEQIPQNISDDAITLKTEDGEYLITVDDSGETPELEVTEIEEGE